MRLTSAASIIAFAGSLTQAQAYWLVAGHIEGLIGGTPIGQEGNSWRRADNLECETLINAVPVVNQMEDVSGDKYGVRIEWVDGECGGNNEWLGTQCPSVVEQHFPEDAQITWYADRGGDVVDLDGNVIGNCVADLSTDKYCNIDAITRSRYQSLLNCS